MKKLFVCLSILAIACVSITGALAIVPHGHGNDLDHSQNTSCPVYQAGLHAPTFALFTAALILIFFSASRYTSSEPTFSSFTRFSRASLRAPPSLA